MHINYVNRSSLCAYKLALLGLNVHLHMQVIACEKIIGWRNRSATGMERGRTRVVLFMTDDAFHYAGEGQVSISGRA